MLPRSSFMLCGLVAVTSTARAQEFSTIQVAGPPVDDFKPVYYGIQAGIFRKYGLNVTVSPVNSGSAAMVAVAGNAAQVAFTNATQVIQSHAHAAPFRIVAPAQWYTTDHPDTLLLARKDSPIHSGRDMNGKTLAVTNLNGLAWIANLNWVEQTGGDSKAVKVLELPNSAMQEALLAGRIDAATFVSPFMEPALATGQIRVLAKSYDWIAKRFMAAAYVSAEYIAANQDTMKRFHAPCTRPSYTPITIWLKLRASWHPSAASMRPSSRKASARRIRNTSNEEHPAADRRLVSPEDDRPFFQRRRDHRRHRPAARAPRWRLRSVAYCRVALFVLCALLAFTSGARAQDVHPRSWRARRRRLQARLLRYSSRTI